MSGFACMECGHKFKTVKAAERASYSDAGCPGCGGSDIDLARAEPVTQVTEFADKSSLTIPNTNPHTGRFQL